MFFGASSGLTRFVLIQIAIELGHLADDAALAGRVADGSDTHLTVGSRAAGGMKGSKYSWAPGAALKVPCSATSADVVLGLLLGVDAGADLRVVADVAGTRS